MKRVGQWLLELLVGVHVTPTPRNVGHLLLQLMKLRVQLRCRLVLRRQLHWLPSHLVRRSCWLHHMQLQLRMPERMPHERQLRRGLRVPHIGVVRVGHLVLSTLLTTSHLVTNSYIKQCV